MSEESLISLLGYEWADCVLHNLPFSFKKKEELSFSSDQDSASNWNYFDFKEKISRMKDI